MSGFTFSHEAESDLRGIWDYISARDEDAALRLKVAILDACDMLAENPGLGHFRRDLTSLAIRFYAVKKTYLIVYDPETKPIMIARVLHGARDAADILRV